MAGCYEPMDVDDVPEDFDNKENAFRHNTPGTALHSGIHSMSEKTCEDLDVSEINMKLRLSCTPLVSSAVEKRFTGSAKKLFTGSEEADTSSASITDSGDITMAAWSMNNHNSRSLTSESDSINSCNNTAVFHSTTPPYEPFNNMMTTLDTTKNGGDVSYLQSHDPKPTSPIMRGLKSVLGMFRPSQSPISSSNDIKVDDRTPDTSINSVQVSTPVQNSTEKKQKGSQLASKIISSDSTNSIVFNEDLINDLKWNDDSTIIFNTEKMPYIQSGSSLNSRGSMPSIESNFETNKNLCKEIEVEDATNVGMLETEVENVERSMNDSNLEFPSQFQQHFIDNKKLSYAKKEIEQLNETCNIVLKSVIEQAQEIVHESSTKDICKQLITNNTKDNTKHTEENANNCMLAKIENNISETDETSPDLMVNPSTLHTECEIKHLFNDNNSISCQLVPNFSEQDTNIPSHSIMNMTTASNATCVAYVNSSAGQTTFLKEDMNLIETCIEPVELCNKEEHIQKQFLQANIGEISGEEIVSSENTSPFISLNAPDENTELDSANNHKPLDYDTIKNPFGTVLKIKMSPPRSNLNCLEMNPYTVIPTISKSPPRDVRQTETSDTSIKQEINQESKHTAIDNKAENNYADQKSMFVPSLRNYETEIHDILHTDINNVAIDPNLRDRNLQGIENRVSDIGSMSNAAPSGSDILYEDNSDTYLSADSGRESEQLLENEIEQIDKGRVITPTPDTENLDENKTLCLSPNYSKMPLTKSGDIKNDFATKSKTSIVPCGLPNYSVRESNENNTYAESALEKICGGTTSTLNSGINEETRNVSPEKISIKMTLKSNKEQVLDNRSSHELKQEQEQKDETNSDGKQPCLKNLQYNKDTVPNYEAITDSSDGSGKIAFEQGSNAIINEDKTILNIDKMASLENEEHISVLGEIGVENSFATKSRSSTCMTDCYSLNTICEVETSPPTSPEPPTKRIDKELNILDSFATKSKLSIVSTCQNKISETHATINDTTVCDESQDTVQNLESDMKKICHVKNSPCADTSTSSDSSHKPNVTVREVHTEDEDTMEGPEIEEALNSSFKSTAQVKSSSPKDHSKCDIKPLEVIMCDDIASAEVAMVHLPSEEEFMDYQDEEFRPGELFINADTFDFLMSQGTTHNTDYGKESLFLKFDPLCARRSSAGTKDVDIKFNKTALHQPEVIIEESPIAQTQTPVKYKSQHNTITSTPENPKTIKDNTQTPENLHNIRDFSENLNITSDFKSTQNNSNTTTVVTSSPGIFNTTRDVTIATENVNATRDITSSLENLNTTREITSALENLNTIRDVTSTPKHLNTTRDVTISNVEIANTTVCVPTSSLTMCSNEKPTMAVPPSTVNNDLSVVTPSASYTPTNTERRSMTFSSPAIAAIDRLISLSGNSSPVTQTFYAENSIGQETREAVVQIQDLLTIKEAEVNQLKQESKELQEKLVDLDIQMKSLQEDNEERLRKIAELKVKLTHKTAMNNNMSAAVAEYERVVASMIAENEEERTKYELEKANLIRERDEQIAHLNSMEGSFSDLHTKYERTKQLILTFKANEEILRRSISEYKVQTEKLEHNYESLKHQAITQLNNANIELDKLKRSHEAEVLKLNTQMRRKELHVASLEESLAQKTKANDELTAICDEIISKVG